MNQQDTFLSNQDTFQTETLFAAENASAAQRFANCLIDMVIFLIVVAGLSVCMEIFFAVAGKTYDNVRRYSIFKNKLPAYLISSIIYVIFYTFCERASSGRTIGKLITGTKAVRNDETAITWKDAFLRSLCRIVPFEALSAFSGYPWHDKWTNTKVVRHN